MDIDREDEKNILVRFVTKLEEPFNAELRPIAIPSNLTRLGLSSIVNGLLKSGKPDWKTEPFDFLIDGELVRLSLQQFLLAKGITAERTLEIEYIKAVAPRKEEEPSLHDDWVSAVDGSSSGFILTGCYDNFARVWKGPGLCTHLLEGHTGPVSSVCIINSEDPQNVTAATASKDRTLRLWKFNAEESFDQPAKIGAYKMLCGHKASVQSVAAQTSGDMVCSGSWDATINLWQTNDMDSEGDHVSIKKRKGNNKVDSLSQGEAVSTLVGHKQQVSSLVWPQRDTIYSASWDHDIIEWDVETGKDSTKIFSGKALNCIDVGGEGSSLIAAGGSDTILRIWDPRIPGSTAPVYQFSSHSSWISACKWHKRSWFHLLSSSYDGKVMLWDLRTAWPLSIIDTHKDKVFSADWWRDDSVISGGADSKLRISSGISV
ncbi:ribosome biogenesis protein WDR12 homolog [Rutidosis leptorrhynchoides]|uniref:ribosome biogenesis protein WDR12 homolog n=1 Tax=Rutidosis leptorrhynchoides TaxID=125765 RepID=UPI003A98F867